MSLFRTGSLRSSALVVLTVFACSWASGLATLVGAKTAGRLVATSAFKVGHGYRLVLPVATYFTWLGTNLKGRGVEPNVEEPISAEALRDGVDN